MNSNSPKLSANTVRELDALRANWKVLVVLALAVITLFVLSMTVPAGWLTYWLGVPPLIIMLMTCVARLNDIGTNCRGGRWNLRRLGFVLVGLATISLLGMPIFLETPDFPSWTETTIRWGVCYVWLTTPGMPPWIQWVWGMDAKTYDGPERRGCQ